MINGDAGALLVAARLAGPDQVPALVSAHAALLGLSKAHVLLVDREQVSLAYFGHDKQRVPIEGTTPGHVFTTGEVILTGSNGTQTAWLPLLDGIERLGVLELHLTPDSAQPSEHERFAAEVAGLIVTKSLYGDRVEQARRNHEMQLAAEMQWALLPPRTFGTERVVISGVVEPAYEIGGDTFDYALNGDILHVALLDAIGHGLTAATAASVAVASYRHARRAKLSLADTAAALDRTIAEQFGGERFVTGWLGELDCASGHLAYVNAGHPAAHILRDGKVVKELPAPPVLPFGLDFRLPGDSRAIAEENLEPGDRLLIFTDGVVEARSDQHGFFGEQRLLDFLEREAASGHSAPEILRRLTRAVLDFQVGALQDDSTMLLIEWLADKPREQRNQLLAAIAEQTRT